VINSRQWQPASRSGACRPLDTVCTAAGDLLFDCGRGVLMRAAAVGSGAAGFRALFLTHLHSDHITDLNDILHDALGHVVGSQSIASIRPEGYSRSPGFDRGDARARHRVPPCPS